MLHCTVVLEAAGNRAPGEPEHWLGTLRTPLAAVHSRSMQCGNLFQVGVPNNSKFWVLYAEGLLPSILGRELLRYVRHNLLTSCCKRATIRKPTSMARLLIIDDDKSFREALAESVRDFGHDVVEASGAQEAWSSRGAMPFPLRGRCHILAPAG